MKRVLSVSLGSSSRDHTVEADFLGHRFQIERIGTDGDLETAMSIIRKYDGQVDAFGLGGIDLYIYAGTRRYTIRDAQRLAKVALKTPVVDGSGLKNTLERKIIDYLRKDLGMVFDGKKVLMVSAADRPGMAEALWNAGASMIFGDLIFSLGIPVPISTLPSFNRIASVIVPVAAMLPFKMLYPTGQQQEKVNPRYSKYYEWADVLAGDFHFIRRYMPENLAGKWIITNTVTQSDIELLKERGVELLITTTPDLGGRSFGTNVMEGVLVALSDQRDSAATEYYADMVDRIGFRPRVIRLEGKLTG